MNTHNIVLLYACYSKYIWKNRVTINDDFFNLFTEMGLKCMFTEDTFDAYVSCSRNNNFYLEDFYIAYQILKDEFEVEEVVDENNIPFLEIDESEKILGFFEKEEIKKMEALAFHFYNYCLENFREELSEDIVIGPIDSRNTIGKMVM